jgi:hypothetical protein
MEQEEFMKRQEMINVIQDYIDDAVNHRSSIEDTTKSLIDILWAERLKTKKKVSDILDDFHWV